MAVAGSKNPSTGVKELSLFFFLLPTKLAPVSLSSKEWATASRALRRQLAPIDEALFFCFYTGLLLHLGASNQIAAAADEVSVVAVKIASAPRRGASIGRAPCLDYLFWWST